MVTEVHTDSSEKLYQCAECGLRYREREIAARCEKWCRAHKSCNIDVIKHAVTEPEKQ